MKISELIEQLKTLKSKYGDIGVVVSSYNGCFYVNGPPNPTLEGGGRYGYPDAPFYIRL